MKTLLACLMGALMLVSVAATPVASSSIISEKPAVVLIDDFYTMDLITLVDATKNLKKGDTLKILSIGPGGNAFVCMAMMNHIHNLQVKGVHVVTETMGLAASANFYIWIMGDERIVNEGDMLMSHKIVISNGYGPIRYENMTPEQKLIYNHLNNYIRQRLLNIVKDAEIVNDMLDDPSNWYTATEAYELGLATKINKAK